MDIESIRHKALLRFYTTANPRGLDGNLVGRVGKMLAFLNAAHDTDDLLSPPNYGAHQLAGDRAGVWSLSVTRNWRMTFTINEAGAIVDLDLEDYH